jgi:Siphovirus Gp157
MTRLDPVIIRFEGIRRNLLAKYPEIDEQTLADTLEGATDLNEAIEAIVRSALEDEVLVVALKHRIQEMRDRFSRIEYTASIKRRAALEAMERVELKKVVAPDFTVSVRPVGPSVIVIEEQEIPASFKVPQPPKLDKRKILEALKTGTTVPGALLSNNANTLSIRTK